MADSLGVVILAAGQGARMKSRTHKVLHTVCGLPMIDHVLRSAASLTPDRTVLVIGHGAEQVRAHLGDAVQYALQDPPQGTGDAVRAARDSLRGSVDTVLVLMGDSPLLRAQTLRGMLDAHGEKHPLVTMLTGHTHDPGRVLRDEARQVVGVVEEKLATPQQLGIPERNSGVYAFNADWLWGALDRLQRSSLGEYLLTDLISQAVVSAGADGPWPVQTAGVEDVGETVGVNTRVQLAAVEAIMQRTVLERLMLSGVTVTDPASTYVHVDVRVGPDTTILPGTHLTGSTVIGEACIIGPSSLIHDSQIGDSCRIGWSVVEGSRVDSGSDVGPYSHLRPGTHIESGVHLGNFVETKQTRVGSGTKSGHVSCLLDAYIGENVNIGAGTITANYDGKDKHCTTIRDGAFIGVDTILRAPIEVGEGARTGAGSVVTRDVAPGKLVVGMPARPVPGRRTGEDESADAKEG